jgi:two-component system, response regulator PdtaR
VPSLFVTGQRDEALRNKQVALGYIGKPYRSELVLSSIDVVNELVNGNILANIPEGLDLFRTSFQSEAGRVGPGS